MVLMGPRRTTDNKKTIECAAVMGFEAVINGVENVLYLAIWPVLTFALKIDAKVRRLFLAFSEISVFAEKSLSLKKIQYFCWENAF